jgi:hypothetical protein
VRITHPFHPLNGRVFELESARHFCLCGLYYILGLPADTTKSIRRDIGIIQRELPLDIVEWVILTPLPGSEDHKIMWRQGVAMDSDLNNYDFEHRFFSITTRSREAVQPLSMDLA